MQDDVAAVVAGLSDPERRILAKVCAGERLLFATRAQDSFRQRLRRLGLIHCVSNPRRWEPLPLGLSVRAALIASGEMGG